MQVGTLPSQVLSTEKQQNESHTHTHNTLTHTFIQLNSVPILLQQLFIYSFTFLIDFAISLPLSIHT